MRVPSEGLMRCVQFFVRQVFRNAPGGVSPRVYLPGDSLGYTVSGRAHDFKQSACRLRNLLNADALYVLAGGRP